MAMYTFSSETSATMAASQHLHFAFGILGNVTTAFLFFSPVITFKRIITNKSTEEFSGLPYVMTMLNCLLSAWYGLPFVTTNNLLVSTTNGTGAGIMFIYVLIFLSFAPNRERRKISALLLASLSIFGAVAVSSMLAFHGGSRKKFCGIAATIFSIVMYGSPLSVIRRVIRTKSVEYMPFWLSFFVVLSCGSWVTYALIGRDLFVGISTGIGLVFGIVQLILYAVYYKTDKEEIGGSPLNFSLA